MASIKRDAITKRAGEKKKWDENGMKEDKMTRKEAEIVR